MFDRWIEPDLINTLEHEGIGAIVFSPLAQGLLTNKYLNGIPEDSRAAKDWGFLKEDEITDEVIGKVQALNELANERGQTLAQMAIAWVLRHPVVTSALIGASKVEHILDLVKVQDKLEFNEEEFSRIEEILK
ncbi:MAG: aldo/keto reductase [Melioribacteraceae bacterium]|nr:aldo/keto reductase [Melioribacteraceae bacterium]